MLVPHDPSSGAMAPPGFPPPDDPPTWGWSPWNGDGGTWCSSFSLAPHEQGGESLPVSTATLSFLLDGPRFGIVPSPWLPADADRDGFGGVVLTHITAGSSFHYYLPDHLGSVRQVRDAGRNLVFAADYEPFGKAYNVYNSEAFQYTGEKRDDATGLVHLRARQYDPDVGRFISLDPVLGSLSYPQTLNRYSYAVNNPLRYTDPTGEIAPLVVLAIILLVAGTAGAGVGVASHYVPAIRPVTDPIADVVSLWPLYGDAYALGYYGSQGGLDCAAGSCDPLIVGINLGGSIPVVGDIGKAVKVGGMGIGFLGLVTKTGRRADDVIDAARGLRSLTARNFRHNLELLTGVKPGKAYQAHHMFPRAFDSVFDPIFAKRGLTIHDPRFGAWFNARRRAQTWCEYNEAWRTFLAPGGRTFDDILDFGRTMGRRYGLEIYF